MSKFFVGCRVRLRYVREPSFNSLVGTEGTVTGVGTYPPGLYEEDGVTRLRARSGDYQVRLDAHKDGSGYFVADQLEPIVPPHEASQYSYTELMDRLKAGEVECV